LIKLAGLGVRSRRYVLFMKMGLLRFLIWRKEELLLLVELMICLKLLEFSFALNFDFGFLSS